MLPRLLAPKIRGLARKFPIVALMGPRQSGKTTLAKSVFPNHAYVSLESPDKLEFAVSDPRGFLAQFRNGVILDEAQRAPALFSYLQEEVDVRPVMGRYILTGSQNFLLIQSVTQSLAGRVGLCQLLPFCMSELTKPDTIPGPWEKWAWKGFYPPVHDRHIQPADWFPGYVRTYVERDVRLVKNITDLRAFQVFLKLCAGRTGQLLNMSALANDLGLAPNTVKSWLSLLEASFLIYLLPPFHNNLGKRLVKSPKLYFLDAGLAAWLVGIETSKQLESHPMRGAFFETLVVGEWIKSRWNRGLESNLHFYRDHQGSEVDGLLDTAGGLLPMEIKSARTFDPDWLRGIRSFTKASPKPCRKALVIYGGEESQSRSEFTLIPWYRAAANLD
jgi:predicted AAA+ superfamily ATPase